MTLPPWVLNEPVDVTCVYRRDGDDSFVIYLVERALRDHQKLEGPNAVALTFGDGLILLNGLPYVEQIENEFWDLCGLIDDAGHTAAPDGVMPIGQCVQSVPIR